MIGYDDYQRMRWPRIFGYIDRLIAERGYIEYNANVPCAHKGNDFLSMHSIILESTPEVEGLEMTCDKMISFILPLRKMQGEINDPAFSVGVHQAEWVVIQEYFLQRGSYKVICKGSPDDAPIPRDPAYYPGVCFYIYLSAKLMPYQLVNKPSTQWY